MFQFSFVFPVASSPTNRSNKNITFVTKNNVLHNVVVTKLWHQPYAERNSCKDWSSLPKYSVKDQRVA